MKKKKVLIIIAFVAAAALVGTGGFVWYQKKNNDAETTALADNQRIAYAYVTDIEGNEITYVEVDESVVTAALETDDTEKTEDADSTEASFGGEAPSMGDTPSGEAPSGDAPSGEMPGADGSDENSMNFGTSTETITATIPVGVTVHTAADTETTFSRLASGDLLKILLETDTDGNEVIVEIWMLQ